MSWLKYFSLLLLLSTTLAVQAESVIPVTGDENGVRLDGRYSLLHDPSGSLTFEDVRLQLAHGSFSHQLPKGSTGLAEGDFWSHFVLENTQSKDVKVFVEYVDHQLIGLAAYVRQVVGEYKQVADLSLERPFSERQVPHNRFVFEINVPAGKRTEVIVRYASRGKGYVFPNLRLWSAKHLQQSVSWETGGMTFLFGGFFVMAIFALVAGFASREKFFYAYSVYALSKIIAWATILGVTHQYVITENFHWSYMSICGAVTIFCGLLFSRLFLQTRLNTPKLDVLLRLMMVNAVILLLAGIFQIKTLALVTITLALLLYPVNFFVGLIRWRQGSIEAGIFALAWSFLMMGLMTQALRDLGFVEHNMFNYYWPLLASYTEVIVIMAAMGLKVRRMREQKDLAEHRYKTHLEHSKAELEEQVRERTREIEQARHAAEIEARTDALTGTRNRRSFFADSAALMKTQSSTPVTFSLLMFDIDNFKDINDNFGHAIGDQALCKFTEVITDKIRDEDIFGRLGGEEFSLLLCGDKQNALAMAERLRREISEMAIDTPIGPLTFTTSIGVAHVSNDAMIEDLVNMADKALYEAKQKGRNQVIEAENANSASNT